MKKLFATICALALAFSVTACNHTSSSPDVKANTNANSTASFAAKPNSNLNSGEINSKINSSSKPEFGYRYKTENYRYDENNKSFRINYPQFSDEIPNVSKINDLMKKTAMQTLDSLGKDKVWKINVKSDISFHNENIISITFDENYALIGTTEMKETYRTVNYDIKKGAQLTSADLILKNDSLNSLVLKKAQDKANKKVKSKITAAVIKKSMESCSIYFEKDKVGFSLPVSHELGDHLEIELKYDEVKPFMTKSDVWNSLTANK